VGHPHSFNFLHQRVGHQSAHYNMKTHAHYFLLTLLPAILGVFFLIWLRDDTEKSLILAGLFFAIAIFRIVVFRKRGQRDLNEKGND
jgi:hypothetical protein